MKTKKYIILILCLLIITATSACKQAETISDEEKEPTPLPVTNETVTGIYRSDTQITGDTPLVFDQFELKNDNSVTLTKINDPTPITAAAAIFTENSSEILFDGSDGNKYNLQMLINNEQQKIFNLYQNDVFVQTMTKIQ